MTSSIRCGIVYPRKSIYEKSNLNYYDIFNISYISTQKHLKSYQNKMHKLHTTEVPGKGNQQTNHNICP